jgi:hypothetical protein
MSLSISSAFLNTGKTFVDLGSGTGRACMCAALSPYGFTKVIGIELMPALCEQSNNVYSKLLGMLNNPLLLPKAVPSSKMVTNKKAPARTFEAATQGILFQYEKENSAKCMPTDLLANAVTKEIGHKSFRVCVKQYKSFVKYLRGKSDMYTVSDSGAEVSTKREFNESGTPVKMDSDNSTTAENKISAQNDSEDLVPSVRRTAGAGAEALSEGAANRTGGGGGGGGVHMDGAGNAAADGNNDGDGDMEGSSELLQQQYQQQQNQYQELQLSVDEVSLLTPLPEVCILQGDMFAALEWWREADVVYAASLLFSEDMMHSLTERALRMKPGAWVVSLKPLALRTPAAEGTSSSSSSSSFSSSSASSASLVPPDMSRRLILRSDSFYKMSWQMAKVYIYQLQ